MYKRTNFFPLSCLKQSQGLPQRQASQSFLERTRSTVCSRGAIQRNSCPSGIAKRAPLAIPFRHKNKIRRLEAWQTTLAEQCSSFFPRPIVSHSLSLSDLWVPPLRLTANCFSQLIIEFAAGPGRRRVERRSSGVKGRKNTPRAHAAFLYCSQRRIESQAASKAHLYTSDNVSWNKAKCVFLLAKGSERDKADDVPRERERRSRRRVWSDWPKLGVAIWQGNEMHWRWSSLKCIFSSAFSLERKLCFHRNAFLWEILDSHLSSSYRLSIMVVEMQLNIAHTIGTRLQKLVQYFC